jgi:hypothetical protein
MISWFNSVQGIQLQSDTETDMITGLLWIIHRDVLGFLHFVTIVLEDISVSATDDHLLQTRLAHWRDLITQFQVELPAMRLSIEKFFKFLEQFQSLKRAEVFIQETLEEIDKVIAQNEKSYAALRTDMALLESKRAINQAESVGRLTELGFIFLPISCVAALFSMQIEPLKSPAPLWSFIATALVTVGVIIAIRLIIRSGTWKEYWRETARKVRSTHDLPTGELLSMRMYMNYYRQTSAGIVLLALGAFGASLLPVIILWVRNHHLDTGYKSTLTLLLIVSSAIVIVPVILRAFERSSRNESSQQGSFTMRRYREMMHPGQNTGGQHENSSSQVAAVSSPRTESASASSPGPGTGQSDPRHRTSIPHRRSEGKEILQDAELAGVSRLAARVTPGVQVENKPRKGPCQGDYIEQQPPPPLALAGTNSEVLIASLAPLPSSSKGSSITKADSLKAESLKADSLDANLDPSTATHHSEESASRRSSYSILGTNISGEGSGEKSSHRLQAFDSQYELRTRYQAVPVSSQGVVPTAKGKEKAWSEYGHPQMGHSTPWADRGRQPRTEVLVEGSTAPKLSANITRRADVSLFGDQPRPYDSDEGKSWQDPDSPCLVCQHLGVTCSGERPTCYHCEAKELACTYLDGLPVRE